MDLHWAWRRARRQPVSTVTVVATLAICIASLTTAYGVAHAILWRPLPFADAERLVFVWERSRESQAQPMRLTANRYVGWRDTARAFASISIFGSAQFALEGTDGATSVGGVRVSPNYFDTVGVRPVIGRAFSAEDEVPGQHRVVILSHAFWTQRFGARSDVVGQPIRLSGQPYIVIGVMPPAMFPGWPVNPATVTIDPNTRQLWVPVPRTPQFEQNSGSHVWGVVARLADNVSAVAAVNELNAAVTAEAADSHGVHLTPLREQFVRDARASLLLLLAATAALLLVACANLTALFISLFESRRVELAIRASLGASLARLGRQLAMEGLLLSLCGGVLGTILARYALRVLPTVLPSRVPFMTAPVLDAQVAAFGIALGLGAGLLLAAWPIGSLVTGGLAPRGMVGRSRSAVYRGLVVAQIATTVGMVVSAALLAQSLDAVEAREAGFVVNDVLVSDIGLPSAAYRDPTAVVQFEERLQSALSQRAGVEGVATAYDHPLEANWSNSYTLVGAVTRGDGDSTGQAELRIVSPSYFQTLGVELLEGRTFADQETFRTSGIAVVNELLARSIGGGVLGRVVRSSPPRFMWGAVVPEEFEIVGVVENERFRGLEQPFLPAVYLSTRQFPQQSVSLLVRTSGQATGISSDLHVSVRSLEPRATVGVPRALTGILHEQLASRRVTTGITGGLAGSALVLAALGIYGLLAAAVATRTHEIGVRLAVGASPALVATQIVRECLSTAGLGVAAGIAIALGTGRVLERLLVGVSARDPSTFALVALALLSVSLCAGLIPAMRAARIDPVITLRQE